jgi:eukaryotic-like serine/threonine-protein kinase
MAVIQENLVIADRFRLVRMIGRGGMGSVWQADHLGLDIPCAVKFIEGELANVAEAHARFEREAKAAAQLRSPNVVQIFDHGVWQGHPYIAMELLEGEDLGKRLAKSGGKLSNGEVNFVIQQVCRALSRAHQAGVVHRDLKPDNIYIVKDDDRDIVKILDFGVAKSASQALDGSNTKTGAMLGTPYYMSPEQAQGIKSVDSRSDLWSLAVIVFQCLTGRLPFESEALGDLLVKIIVSPVPTPSHYNPLIPVGFDNWWVKAADRNPENRYPNAKTFADTLALALGQSSNTDASGNRLGRNSEKPGGATAMMANGPGTEIFQHVPNTPMPGAHTAALVTPNPAGGQQQHQQQQQQPHGGSQPGYGQQQQFSNTPQGAWQQPPSHTTGNPVIAGTFSGVEGVPKKGAPIALFIGIGALALVGITLGGVAVVKGRSSGSGADPMGSASAAMSASAMASAEVAPSASVAATASAVASAGSSAPSASAAAADPPKDPVAAATHRPATNPVNPVVAANPAAAKPGAGVAAPAVKPGAPVAAPPPPPPPPGGKKPLNLGF